MTPQCARDSLGQVQAHKWRQSRRCRSNTLISTPQTADVNRAGMQCLKKIGQRADRIPKLTWAWHCQQA